MTKNEIEYFIEEMEAIGDEWTADQVEDVYGDYSLKDALDHRKSLLGSYFNNIANFLNM